MGIRQLVKESINGLLQLFCDTRQPYQSTDDANGGRSRLDKSPSASKPERKQFQLAKDAAMDKSIQPAYSSTSPVS